MALVRSRFIALAAIAAAFLVVIAGGARGLAQDATPTGDMASPMASPMAGSMAMAPIPNHIHAGTCDNLGDVVQPLADLEYRNLGGMVMGTPAAGSDMASPMAGGDMASPMASMMGALSSVPVAAATTNVDLTLDQILSAEHAINLHDPADPGNPDRYLACGDIGGSPDAEGNLFVGLAEQNESGHFGVAWLLDNGTGTTVTVFLANSGAMGGGATDMGTPEALGDDGTPAS